MRRVQLGGWVALVFGVGMVVTACGTSDLDDGSNLGIDAGRFDGGDASAKDASATTDAGITRDGSTTDGSIVVDASVTDAAPDAVVVEDAGVPDADPCATVVCATPPAAECQGTDAVTYPAAGACNAGVCSYAPTKTDCAAQNKTCAAGACGACAPGFQDDDANGTCEPVPSKRVFVTAATFAGRNLGGIAGADAKCQAAAAAANLTGTFKAWLGDPKESPSTSFVPAAAGYALVDGTKVATGWADLVDGTLLAPIDVTETGAKAPANARAWTGTDASGVSVATTARTSCASWTGPAAQGAMTGTVASAGAAWAQTDTQRCITQNHLYCFEQ